MEERRRAEDAYATANPNLLWARSGPMASAAAKYAA